MATTVTIQVIHEDKSFNDHLKVALQDWGLLKSGLDYHVISVFGSQSTGKSTLLNRLFGTRFAIMDETSRQQTTKGIWASLAHGSQPPIIVMDVEGTDGRERGEDQDFERKSALFSLAISEVLIINMWEASVGLYQGANMGLLKTVFDIHVNLFQDPTVKTRLLFVIRDFTNRTPLENLILTLKRDVKNIWTSVSKPTDRPVLAMEDLFDFSFVALPHKIYQPEQFESGAALLRDRFYNPSLISSNEEGYLFSPKYHKKIPADGFPLFAANIWEKIVNNKDLDLPTQQELLAQFRCDDISKLVFDHFSEFCAPLKRKLEGGEVLDFKVFKDKIDDCLAEFDKDASRYNKAVYIAKRAEFQAELLASLDVFVMLQLNNIQKIALAPLRKDFKLTATALKDCQSFMSACKLLQAEAVSFYQGKSSALQEAGFIFEDQVKAVQEEIDTLLLGKLEKAAQLVLEDLKSSVEITKDSLLALLNEGKVDLWDRVWSLASSALKESVTELETKIVIFHLSVDRIKSLSEEYTQSFWHAFVTLLIDYADLGFVDRLKSRFDTHFRFDVNGIPKLWKADDDLKGPFETGRTEAGKLSTLLSTPTGPLANLPEMKRFSDKMHPAKIASFFNAFKKEADSTFIEVQRGLQTTSTKIPPWFIILTLALGWNEIVSLLRNPLLLVLVILVVVVGLLVMKLGILPHITFVIRQVIQSPIWQVLATSTTSTGGGDGGEEGDGFLRELTPVPGSLIENDSIELRPLHRGRVPPFKTD